MGKQGDCWTWGYLGRDYDFRFRECAGYVRQWKMQEQEDQSVDLIYGRCIKFSAKADDRLRCFDRAE
jgi:hypothetical protein